MKIDQFKAKYAFNERREFLFDELERFIKKVDEFLSPYLLAVYGSYITNKPAPGDIDVILHGFVKQEKLLDWAPGTLQCQCYIHVMSDITSYTLYEKKLKDISVIISDLCNTEENKAENFNISSYVEILI